MKAWTIVFYNFTVKLGQSSRLSNPLGGIIIEDSGSLGSLRIKGNHYFLHDTRRFSSIEILPFLV